MAALAANLPAQSVVGTITRSGLTPTAIAVYEAGDRVYISDITAGYLYIHDGTTLTEVGSYNAGGWFGLTVDEAHAKLYLSGYNSGIITVLNASTGEFLHNVAGTYTHPSTWIDATAGKLYIWGAGSLFQVDTASETVTPVVSAAITSSHRMLGVNPVTHEAYLVRNDVSVCELVVVNGTTLEVAVVPGFGYAGGGYGINWGENKLYACSLSGAGSPTQVLDRDTGVITEIFTNNDAQRFYYQPTSNRIYTSSEVNGISSVIDGPTDAIFNLPISTATSVAFRNSTGHVYYAATSFVGVFDEQTQMLEAIPVANPYAGTAGALGQAIVVNQTTGRVFAAVDSRWDTVTVVQDQPRLDRPPVYLGNLHGFPSKANVLDPGTKSVVGELHTIYYPSGDHALAVRPGGGRLYLPSANAGMIATFAGLGSASDLAACDIGYNSPRVIAIMPDGSRAFVSNSTAGNMGIVDLATNTLSTTVATGSTPWGVAVAPDGSRVYVANKGAGNVSVINTATNTIESTITVGPAPWGIALNPPGTRAFVTNSSTNSVSVIETASNTVTNTIPVGTTPHWLAVTPDGRHVYVGNRNGGTVSVIDANTCAVIQTVTVGAEPEGVMALPDGSEVWVANSAVAGTSTISVINTTDFSVSTITGLPEGSSFYDGHLVAYSLAVADPTARFAGKVTVDGSPVPGVTVLARQSGVTVGSATTSANGEYCIFNLSPGTYDLEVGTVFALAAQAANAGRVSVLNFPGETPGFTTPPQSQTVVIGADVTFPVVATGTPPLTYQWKKGETVLTDGGNISGATTATLALGSVTLADSGTYTVTVTNGLGERTSDAVTLTVNKLGQTITFGTLAQRTFGDPPFDLSATASSGLPVSFAVFSGPATIAGSTVTLTGTGTVTIRASQGGNATYQAAPEVDRSFEVTAAAVGFTSWQQAEFSAPELLDPNVSGPNAVYGQDGLPNLLKYALGLDPKVNTTSGLPGTSTTATDWVYTYTRPSDRTDLTYSVEISTDLQTWTAVGVVHEQVSASGGQETWEARYPLGSAGTIFFRLKVTR